MCWSGEASTVLAGIGIGTTIVAARRREDFRLWMPLGYFSLMEALQAFTYGVIDDCGSPANQVATLLGWIHVAFQPLLANHISLYFIPRHMRNAIEGWVYAIVSTAVVVMLVNIYPFTWAPSCREGLDVICGERLCSVTGDWHIAWEMNRHMVAFGGTSYILAAYVLPLLYGSWRMSLYHIVSGPFLAFVTTRNPNEFAAVWCLYSIGLLLVVAKTPVRKWLFVTRWPGYGWFGRRTVTIDCAGQRP